MRTSNIISDAAGGYVVMLIEDNQVVETRKIDGEYDAVKELVENWESGLIQLLTEN